MKASTIILIRDSFLLGNQNYSYQFKDDHWKIL